MININLNSKLERLLEIQEKYYSRMTQEQKDRFDAAVIRVMGKLEASNRRLQEVQQLIPAQMDFEPMENILTQTERFERGAKEEPSEEEVVQSPSFLQTAREKVHSLFNEVKREPEKNTEEKLWEKVESFLIRNTKEERKEIAKALESQFQQGCISRAATQTSHLGYKAVKHIGLAKPSQPVDDAIEMGYELLDLRVKVVNEATKLITEPNVEIRKFMKKYSS